MVRVSEAEKVRAIRLAWSSLESHLEPAEKPIEKKLKKFSDVLGDQRFHKQCVREYAEIINTLARAL